MTRAIPQSPGLIVIAAVDAETGNVAISCTMRPDHEQAIADFEKLLPKVATTAAEAATAHAVERGAELKVLERVVDLLTPHFEKVTDTVIVKRKEFGAEADPSMNQLAPL